MNKCLCPDNSSPFLRQETDGFGVPWVAHIKTAVLFSTIDMMVGVAITLGEPCCLIGPLDATE